MNSFNKLPTACHRFQPFRSSSPPRPPRMAGHTKSMKFSAVAVHLGILQRHGGWKVATEWRGGRVPVTEKRNCDYSRPEKLLVKGWNMLLHPLSVQESMNSLYLHLNSIYQQSRRGGGRISGQYCTWDDSLRFHRYSWERLPSTTATEQRQQMFPFISLCCTTLNINSLKMQTPTKETPTTTT